MVEIRLDELEVPFYTIKLKIVGRTREDAPIFDKEDFSKLKSAIEKFMITTVEAQFLKDWFRSNKINFHAI